MNRDLGFGADRRGGVFEPVNAARYEKNGVAGRRKAAGQLEANALRSACNHHHGLEAGVGLQSRRVGPPPAATPDLH